MQTKRCTFFTAYLLLLHATCVNGQGVGLLASGYYCPNPSTIHYSTACCHAPFSYTPGFGACQSIFSSIDPYTGDWVYPLPTWTANPCRTNKDLSVPLNAQYGIMRCNKINTVNSPFYDYGGSLVTDTTDVYFCAYECQNPQPCPPCPSNTQYRVGCGQFPFTITKGEIGGSMRSFALADLLQSQLGTCFSCPTCDPGFGYTGCDSIGNAQCTACGPSQYSAGGYQQCASCSTCYIGMGYNGCSSTGVAQCTTCPSGTYGAGVYSACQSCPSGSSSQPGSVQITGCICNSGYYASLKTSSAGACLHCDPGNYMTFRYTTEFGQTLQIQGLPTFADCVYCPLNYYCTGGSAPPAVCGPGFLCSSYSMSQPLPCPPGRACPGAGLVYSCVQGFYCPLGSASPVPCPAGTWGSVLLAADVSTGCAGVCGMTTCAYGNCPACSAGQYTASCGGASQGFCVLCATCGAGKYQAGCWGNGTTDDSKCVACGAGQISADKARQCSACPPFSAPDANAISCVCNTGYTQSGSGCVACDTCNSGYYRSGCAGTSPGVCVSC